jgi:hypothetical protein
MGVVMSGSRLITNVGIHVVLRPLPVTPLNAHLVEGPGHVERIPERGNLAYIPVADRLVERGGSQEEIPH